MKASQDEQKSGIKNKRTHLGIRRSSLFRFFTLWAASYLVLMSFFFNNVLKSFNYLDIFPAELLFPLIMHAVTALIISTVIYSLPLLKTYTAKLVSVASLSLFMNNYDINLQGVASTIRAFVPGLTAIDPLYIVSIFYLLALIALSAIVGLLSELIIKKLKRIKNRDVVIGLYVFIGYLFTVQAFSMIKILPSMVQESGVQATEFSVQTSNSGTSDMPDIYYIVLDRYTNSEVLGNQFNFNNNSFTAFLENNNFYVNKAANATYPKTAMSISATLNARFLNEYVEPFKNNDIQSYTLFHNLAQQSSVVKALKKIGYKYYSIGTWYGTSNKAPLADRDYMFYESTLSIFGHAKHLRGIENSEFLNSLYYRFAQIPKTWWPIKVSTNDDRISSIRSQLTTLDDLTTKEKTGGRFIFAHILVPHDPYVFNSDGSFSTNINSDSIGKPIKQKYVSQVEFINSQMEELVTKIRKNSDNKAVIIINGDEGPFPQLLNDTFKEPQSTEALITDVTLRGQDMREWSNNWVRMKFGILQAVYIPKATKYDLDHLSSTNLFRIVLNRYAGYKLDYLPQCNFGLGAGSLGAYDFVNITDRLTTNADKKCEAYLN